MVVPLDMFDLDSAAAGPWTLDVPNTTTLVLVGANDELTGIPQGIAAAIDEIEAASEKVQQITAKCELKVERSSSIDCSSPISTMSRSNKAN